MIKFKHVLAVFLFFGLFSNLQASELKRLCGLKAPSYSGTASQGCDEESGIVFFGGPGCYNEVFMSIYFSNLIGFNNLPTLGGVYSLPAVMPDLYVQLDIDFDGDYETTLGPINDFIYDGVNLESLTQPGQFHYLFERELDITEYFIGFNPCPDDEEKTVSIRLMQPMIGGLGYELFDPIPFGTTNDYVSCEVFHETCSLCTDARGNPIAPNCGTNASLTEYDVDVCIDCTTNCEENRRGVLEDNQFVVTTTKNKSETVISPNPFSDEVTVTFQTQMENASTEIEIYDWTGALILKKSFSPEIGNRKINLDMGTLPKGVYYLNLINDETRTTSKIIKL